MNNPANDYIEVTLDIRDEIYQIYKEAELRISAPNMTLPNALVFMIWQLAGADKKELVANYILVLITPEHADQLPLPIDDEAVESMVEETLQILRQDSPGEVELRSHTVSPTIPEGHTRVRLNVPSNIYHIFKQAEERVAVANMTTPTAEDFMIFHLAGITNSETLISDFVASLVTPHGDPNQIALPFDEELESDLVQQVLESLGATQLVPSN